MHNAELCFNKAFCSNYVRLGTARTTIHKAFGPS